MVFGATRSSLRGWCWARAMASDSALACSRMRAAEFKRVAGECGFEATAENPSLANCEVSRNGDLPRETLLVGDADRA